MAYVGINKLEHHLNGTDVDENGEIISLMSIMRTVYILFFSGTKMFSKTSYTVITV
jgi:hypothetical protein